MLIQVKRFEIWKRNCCVWDERKRSWVKLNKLRLFIAQPRSFVETCSIKISGDRRMKERAGAGAGESWVSCVLLKAHIDYYYRELPTAILCDRCTKALRNRNGSTPITRKLIAKCATNPELETRRISTRISATNRTVSNNTNPSPSNCQSCLCVGYLRTFVVSLLVAQINSIAINIRVLQFPNRAVRGLLRDFYAVYSFKIRHRIFYLRTTSARIALVLLRINAIFN